jgi:hypothetical protein
VSGAVARRGGAAGEPRSESQFGWFVNIGAANDMDTFGKRILPQVIQQIQLSAYRARKLRANGRDTWAPHTEVIVIFNQVLKLGTERGTRRNQAAIAQARVPHFDDRLFQLSSDRQASRRGSGLSGPRASNLAYSGVMRNGSAIGTWTSSTIPDGKKMSM